MAIHGSFNFFHPTMVIVNIRQETLPLMDIGPPWVRCLPPEEDGRFLKKTISLPFALFLTATVFASPIPCKQ